MSDVYTLNVPSLLKNLTYPLVPLSATGAAGTLLVALAINSAVNWTSPQIGFEASNLGWTKLCKSYVYSRLPIWYV